MEVKIGLQNVGREIVLESSLDAEAVGKLVSDALSKGSELRLTDDKGRQVIVRHGKYGIAVPAGVSLGVGALSWIAFIAAGFGYQPGLTWIPWVLPIVLGTAAAAGVAVFLGRTRTVRDTEALTKALRL